MAANTELRVANNALRTCTRRQFPVTIHSTLLFITTYHLTVSFDVFCMSSSSNSRYHIAKIVPRKQRFEHGCRAIYFILPGLFKTVAIVLTHIFPRASKMLWQILQSKVNAMRMWMLQDAAILNSGRMWLSNLSHFQELPRRIKIWKLIRKFAHRP